MNIGLLLFESFYLVSHLIWPAVYTGLVGSPSEDSEIDQGPIVEARVSRSVASS